MTAGGGSLGAFAVRGGIKSDGKLKSGNNYRKVSGSQKLGSFEYDGMCKNFSPKRVASKCRRWRDITIRNGELFNHNLRNMPGEHLE